MRYPKPDNFKPETHFPPDWSAVKKRGTPRCQSWNPNAGRQCNSSPMKGGGGIRCDSHGGKTPKGLASSHTKHGLYSKYLPAQLSGSYQNLLTLGQDLFRIDNETAVLTALIQDQLAKIELGESGAAWGELLEVYNELERLGQKTNKSPEDVRRFNAAFIDLGKLISSGSSTYQARSEAVSLMEQKRKLVADERKDWAAKHQAMSFDRVLLLMTAMAASFKQSLDKHVTDDGSRRSVLSDTQTFLDKVISK